MKNFGQKTDSKDIVNKEDLVGKQDALPTTSTAGKVLKSTSTAGVVEWGDASSGGTATTVKVDGTSITSNNEADLKTKNGNYNASTNKLATESDLPTINTDWDKVSLLKNRELIDSIDIVSGVEVVGTGRAYNYDRITFTKTPIDSDLEEGQAVTQSLTVTYDSEPMSGSTRGISSGAVYTALLNIFPVGSIYMSTIDTSPAGFIGGHWEKLTGDAYLKIVQSAAGNYAGTSSVHQIPVTSMPSHSHALWTQNNYSSNAIGLRHSNKANGIAGIDQGSNPTMQWATTQSKDEHAIMQNTGGGQAYYPYYYGIYAWRRTS